MVTFTGPHKKLLFFRHTTVLLFENVFVLYPMQQVIYTNYSIILKKKGLGSHLKKCHTCSLVRLVWIKVQKGYSFALVYFLYWYFQQIIPKQKSWSFTDCQVLISWPWWWCHAQSALWTHFKDMCKFLCCHKEAISTIKPPVVAPFALTQMNCTRICLAVGRDLVCTEFNCQLSHRPKWSTHEFVRLGMKAPSERWNEIGYFGLVELSNPHSKGTARQLHLHSTI